MARFGRCCRGLSYSFHWSHVLLLHRFSRWWAIFWQTWIRWVSQMHWWYFVSQACPGTYFCTNHRWRAFHQSFRAKTRSKLGSVNCIACLQARNWQKTRRGNFCLIWSHLTTSSCQSCHSFRAADVHKTCFLLCCLYHSEWCCWYFVLNSASVLDLYVSIFVTTVQLHSDPSFAECFPAQLLQLITYAQPTGLGCIAYLC